MKRVTLTFDNGPTPGITERVVDLLRVRHISATFFVIGERLRRPGARESAVRAHSEGHWIGNHTLTHSAPLGENASAEFARKEIEETQVLIGELAHPDKLFRPMGGGGLIGAHLLSAAAIERLREGKYTCVLWSSVPGDWKDQESWVERCMAEIEERDWTTVVLHDIENGCLPRLAEFLDRLETVGVDYRQDFPEDVVMIRRGEATSPELSRILG